MSRGIIMKTKLLLFILALFVSIPAYSDTIRCKGGLVTTGDSKYELMRKCGKPAFSEVTSGANNTKTEAYYFNQGKGRFPRIIGVRGSRVVTIRPDGMRE